MTCAPGGRARAQDRGHEHGRPAVGRWPRLGGFDPAFRFYLDETDLNLRLAAEGAAVA